MNSKSWFFAISICFSVFVCSCGSSERGGESSGEISSRDAGGSTEAAGLTIPSIIKEIPYLQAFEMSRTFSGETIEGDKMNKLVWTDIQSMKEMLQKMEEEQNQTHVRVYFGIKEDEVCLDQTHQRRRYLTVFFEGARYNGQGCEPNVCEPCELNEDERVVTIKPYDIMQPCPPPHCNGFSRYFEFNKSGAGGVTKPVTIRELPLTEPAMR